MTATETAPKPAHEKPIDPDEIRCSFCTLPRSQVRNMILAPAGVAICDECVLLCMEILCNEGYPDIPERIRILWSETGQLHHIVNEMRRSLLKQTRDAINKDNEDPDT